jgi:hypothetical protein
MNLLYKGLILKINHFILTVIVFSLCNPLFSGGIYPKRGITNNVSSVVSDLKSKGYILEPKSQFHIRLKPKESVRYIITSPFYLSNAALGIATDESVKKVQILLYTLSGRDDSHGLLVAGEESENTIYLKEIKERSYYYMVEITLLDSQSTTDYSSIDLLYGFKSMNLAKEDPVTKEIYYNHTDEKILFSSPNPKSKKEKPTPSDSGGVPCTSFDYGRNCMGR